MTNTFHLRWALCAWLFISISAFSQEEPDLTDCTPEEYREWLLESNGQGSLTMDFLNLRLARAVQVSKDAGIVVELLRWNTNPNFAPDGLPLLYLAAKDGRPAEIARHLLHAGANPRFLDENGFSPFLVACARNPDAAIAMLDVADERHDRNPSSWLELDRVYPGQTSALSAAVVMENQVLLDRLLASGANPTIDPIHANTIIVHCIYEGKVESFHKLLRFSELEVLLSQQGLALLPHASLQRDRTYMESLLRKGIPIDQVTEDGFSSLHFASETNNLDFVQWLLKQGADPNLASPDGTTPFHKAAAFGELKLLKALWLAGGNPLLQTSYGYSPLESAHYMGRADNEAFLLEHGAINRFWLRAEWADRTQFFEETYLRLFHLRPIPVALLYGVKETAKLLLESWAIQDLALKRKKAPR